MRHMTVNFADEDWDNFRRNMVMIRKNIESMGLPAEAIRSIEAVRKNLGLPFETMRRFEETRRNIAGITAGLETFRKILEINRESLLSISTVIEKTYDFDAVRRSVGASLTQHVDAPTLSRATRHAEDFRKEIGVEAFDGFADEGQKQDLLGSAPWRLSDAWQSMPQETRRHFEWLLAGVIWIVVICGVAGINVEFPVIERLMEDIGISAYDIANASSGLSLLWTERKRRRRSHPIDKKVKR